MHTPHSRLTRLVSASVAARMAAFGFVAPLASHAQPENKATPGASSSAKKHTTITSTNVASGKIKHVWLIILENKSYDATFSGLNQNSYLWKELPKQGALLPHYFGTGHYSQDNYTSMVSGQSAEMDLQSDCDVANTSFGSNASIIDRHTGKEFGRDDNYGQVLSLAGPNAADGKPDYSKPLSTPPKNHTGGLYAADLWLRYYIPLIEKSDAFKDGGLIDVTFDEANPPFTNMSFNNATDDTDVAKAARKEELYNYSPQTIKDLAEGYKKYDANTFPKPSKMSKNYVKADLAGQNINGENVDWEPTGPNSTLETDEHGNQLFPGPGDNGYITRPPSCEQDTDLVNADKSNCVHGAKNTGAGWGYSKAKTIDVSNTAGTSKLTGKVTVTDLGRKVTGEGIPDGAHVGKVANQGPNMVADPKDGVTNSSFVIVDANDKPLKTTADVTSVTLSATGVPGHLADDESPLATFNAQDATPGGGATGSVLISPYIKPGTVSNTYYNHFSWLRTMEDLFEVSKGNDTRELEAGTVSTGLDGDGHLGFAAQAGLGTFGKDVFNNLPTEPNPSASASASTTPSAAPTATATRSTAPGAAPGDDGNGSRPSLPRTGNGEVSDPAAAESAIAGLVVVGAAVSAWAIRRKRR